MTSVHLQCGKNLKCGYKKQETIDSAAQVAQERSFQKWKAILARILDCILYLARHTLPLHGHSEGLSTDDNCVKFPRNFKLLAKYDPVANQHLHKAVFSRQMAMLCPISLHRTRMSSSACSLITLEQTSFKKLQRPCILLLQFALQIFLVLTKCPK